MKRYNPDVRKAWYERKRQDPEYVEKLRSQERERSLKLKTFINNYKITQGCKDCGYKLHAVALDFDHIIGVKEINIANTKSISQALREIEKCEVVCANCHRIRTLNRLNQ